MVFDPFLGLTAIDVSLCGLLPSQSVTTLAAFDVAVVQIARPTWTFGPFENTVAVTGAGAWVALWTKSIGGLIPSSGAVATPTPSARLSTAAAAMTPASR